MKRIPPPPAALPPQSAADPPRCYTGQTSLNKDSWVGVEALANLFKVEALVDYCREFGAKQKELEAEMRQMDEASFSRDVTTSLLGDQTEVNVDILTFYHMMDETALSEACLRHQERVLFTEDEVSTTSTEPTK
jgi:hypothetical protein